jgi:nuclear GTP-binding protein
MVLNDWNTGKIKYYTHPPEVETRSTHISAEIVSAFSKEFSLDTLDKMEEDEWQNLPTVLPSQTMLIESSGIVADNAKQEESMDTDSSDDENGDDNQVSILLKLFSHSR